MKRPTLCRVWKHRAYFTSLEAARKFEDQCRHMSRMFPVVAYYCQGGAVVVWD